MPVNEVRIDMGGGGGAPSIPLAVSKTYSQLLTDIAGSGLVTGQKILITDFQIRTYIQFSGAIGAESINVGINEPMLATAISPNAIAREITSTIYPTDIIYYEPIIADRDYDCAYVVGNYSTGAITYRMDENNNARDYDWRNTIFRRWETINGSGVYDSYIDTGFAFNDYPAFNFANSANHYINSPLIARTFIAYPYWLDNFVIVNGCLANRIYLGVATTVKDNMVLTQAQRMLYDVWNNCFFSNFNTSSNNKINDGNYNNISDFEDNVITTNFAYNSGSAITSNTFVDFTNNDIRICTANTCDTVIYNTIDTMQNNVSIDVSYNNCNLISFNTMDNSITTTAITHNNCNQINNNEIVNIGFNNSNSISANINLASGFGSITGNTSKNIQSNKLSTASSLINNNVCRNEISNNIDCGITGNNSDIILNNTSSVIEYNNVTRITGNVFIANLSDNAGDEIINNSNLSTIQYNNVVQILTNTSNSGVGSITNNTAALISTNVLDSIAFNIVSVIFNNSDAAGGGDISYNVGSSVSENTNVQTIGNNNIWNIFGNDMNGTSFTANEGQFFNANTFVLAGNLKDCMGVNIKSCQINNTITNNTFLAALSAIVPLTPTASMIAVTPSITLYDVTNGNVDQVLTAGVLTYNAF